MGMLIIFFDNDYRHFRFSVIKKGKEKIKKQREEIEEVEGKPIE